MGVWYRVDAVLQRQSARAPLRVYASSLADARPPHRDSAASTHQPSCSAAERSSSPTSSRAARWAPGEALSAAVPATAAFLRKRRSRRCSPQHPAAPRLAPTTLFACGVASTGRPPPTWSATAATQGALVRVELCAASSSVHCSASRRSSLVPLGSTALRNQRPLHPYMAVATRCGPDDSPAGFDSRAAAIYEDLNASPSPSEASPHRLRTPLCVKRPTLLLRRATVVEMPRSSMATTRRFYPPIEDG